MSRFARRTIPLETLGGTLTNYPDQIEPLLAECEFKGRRWVFEVAQNSPHRAPTDVDILELHRRMFAGVFSWAGCPRTSDVGAGGVVFVPWHEVRIRLRELGENIGARVEALGSSPTLEQIAELIADVHHRFQWVHPFVDTNGRTGRVLDHYLLWVTFDLVGPDFASTRAIEYFPDAQAEHAYYEGLAEADNHRPELLRDYYFERLRHAFESRSAP